MLIPFNKSPLVGGEIDNIGEAILSKQLCGDGEFTKKSELLLENMTGTKKALLTPSCTAALELAALLLDLKEGDEVIAPSYTFVSTANAFALRGVRIVFVDVTPNTMNIDPKCIEAAITTKTKAIVPVHYAGVACDMDAIMALANKHQLYVVEDAAQAIGSYYKGKHLGSIGHLGTLSFHGTKNITSGGEGGALLINDSSMVDRACIIREKGTNRSQFFQGLVDKYSWVDIGSSYLLSEIQAAYLFEQLEYLLEINMDRLTSWGTYYSELEELSNDGLIELPIIPSYASNNAHMFYLKCKSLIQRTELIAYLKSRGISAAFHYVPLHSSLAGLKFGRFGGQDVYTTSHSERLVRLPMYYGLAQENVREITGAIKEFFV